MSLFDELKRRRVFRVAVVYAATAFVVLQVADLLASGLGLPDWLFPAITVAVVLGFPIARVLGWALEVTAEGGIRRTAAAAQGSAGEAAPPLGTRTVVVAGVLVAVGIGLSAG